MDRKTRVLVVDDERSILRFISTALTAAGYGVVTTDSGEEALKLAKSDQFDVMLLDIVMLPLSGFQVLEELRKFSPLPVITLTARSGTTDEAARLGANAFIYKPFRPEELVRKIEEVLSQQAGQSP